MIEGREIMLLEESERLSNQATPLTLRKWELEEALHLPPFYRRRDGLVTLLRNPQMVGLFWEAYLLDRRLRRISKRQVAIQAERGLPTDYMAMVIEGTLNNNFTG